MKRYYDRRLREIGSSHVISIPTDLKSRTSTIVTQWINPQGNVEIALNQNGSRYSNGLIVSASIFNQGGSKSMIIHPEILYMLGLKKNPILRIWLNKNGNLELKPRKR